MFVNSIRFRFRQNFRASARRAYEWCTDYQPSDSRLFKQKWRREVHQLSDDAIILTETTWPKGRRRVIRRLIRLSPQDLSWTNTHISGPFLHSQYWYQIVPDGSRRSHLVFTGMRLVRTSKRLSPSQKGRLVDEEIQDDSTLWRNRIAPVMERELANV